MIDDNLIIIGDNYEKTKELLTPKSVDLILTDPLWNTDQRWLATNNKGEVGYYEDNVFKSLFHYLEWLELRIRLWKEVYLRESGHFFLHISPEVGHYVKVKVLDKIWEPFPKYFKNEIAWCYSRWTGDNIKQLPDLHHHIYWYVMSDNYTWNPIRIPLETPRKRNLVDGKTRKSLRDEQGNVVYRMQTDRPLRDWWDDIFPVPKKGGERVDYPTQKPLDLCKRIIELTTNPGDVVFDPFMGSGTALLAAFELGRRFIGIDHEQTAINKTTKRLNDIGAPYIIKNGDVINVKGLDEMSDYEYQCFFIEKMHGIVRGKGPDGALDGFIPTTDSLVAITRRQVGRRDVDIFASAMRRQNKKNGIMLGGGGFTNTAEKEIARLRFNKELNIEQKYESDFGFTDSKKVEIYIDGTIFKTKVSGFRNPIVNYSWYIDDIDDGYGGRDLFGAAIKQEIKDDKYGVQDFSHILKDGRSHIIRCVATDSKGASEWCEVSYKL